ncbi:hypothetical protein [Pseudovibrio sp. SPO723]|uniref:hypothetical protein n=1 Tax=Nesiotobacter zosterae TaxID=392721 RepID=UPI0029C1DF44|nr:hypothetical protein [Pseudovibrio sp. SPO723]MDX5592603.1 hypothetical protein [Pseudovibrio sp. SPO723]
MSKVIQFPSGRRFITSRELTDHEFVHVLDNETHLETALFVLYDDLVTVLIEGSWEGRKIAAPILQEVTQAQIELARAQAKAASVVRKHEHLIGNYATNNLNKASLKRITKMRAEQGN